MKKILITGANSYIGSKFKEWVKNYPGEYSVEMMSVRNDSWKNISFADFDVVYHVAGIVHKKEKRKNKDIYYKINRDLTVNIAKKAKKDGVKQFIFLSTMSVYGLDEGIIDYKTDLNPKTNYGKSKLQAENLLKKLDSDNFKVIILRPPMVYGKECKGNYRRLSNLARITPIFPDIDNKRSMIYIDHLSELVRLLIENNERGLILIQNKDYVNTSFMVSLISNFYGNKIRFTKLFNSLLIRLRINTVKKIFGNLVYDKEACKYVDKYNLYSFRQTIEFTEREL